VKFRYLLLVLIVLLAWYGLSGWAGSALVPTPHETARTMWGLLLKAETWRNLLITFFRGCSGLLMAFVLGSLAGVVCGLRRWVMDLLSPLVSAVQACPTIIWITLLMVWAGVGSVVPIIAIFVTTFPVFFVNAAQGTAAVDRRLFEMARLYHVPPTRRLKQVVLPGIRPYILAGLSYALGICWKVAATAEFIGSSSGVGARIYWAFRFLEMPQLFCWAILLMLFGVLLEAGLIRPLRQQSGHMPGEADK
jgi:ABC-type nitrate/sulfonate/bicarbonate transport system permease component